MKIRNGFISNSSSSSFILLAPIDYEYLEKIEDEDLKVLYEKCFDYSTGKVGELDVRIYSGWADTSCGENTIADSMAFENYCQKKNVSDDDYCEVAEKLFFEFSEYFDKDKCLYVGRD